MDNTEKTLVFFIKSEQYMIQDPYDKEVNDHQLVVAVIKSIFLLILSHWYFYAADISESRISLLVSYIQPLNNNFIYGDKIGIYYHVN